jgi:hypothetical protein
VGEEKEATHEGLGLADAGEKKGHMRVARLGWPRRGRRGPSGCLVRAELSLRWRKELTGGPHPLVEERERETAVGEKKEVGWARPKRRKGEAGR